MNEIHVDDNNRPLLNIRIKHTIIFDSEGSSILKKETEKSNGCGKIM